MLNEKLQRSSIGNRTSRKFNLDEDDTESAVSESSPWMTRYVLSTLKWAGKRLTVIWSQSYRKASIERIIIISVKYFDRKEEEKLIQRRKSGTVNKMWDGARQGGTIAVKKIEYFCIVILSGCYFSSLRGETNITLARALAQLVTLLRVENQLCPQMAGSPSCEIPAT